MSGGFFSLAQDGLKSVLRKIKRSVRQIEKSDATIAREYGEFILSEIQKNLSGAPGMPQRISGDLRASWVVMPPNEDGSVVVMSTSPYAARQEEGFTGFDSMGRYYSQSGFGYVAAAKVASHEQRGRIVHDIYKRDVTG